MRGVPRKTVEAGTNIKNIRVRKEVSIDASDLSLKNSKGESIKDKIIGRTNVGNIKMKRNIKRKNNSINLKKKS